MRIINLSGEISGASGSGTPRWRLPWQAAPAASRLTMLAAILATSLVSVAPAQTASTGSSEPVEEVIVTGTAGGAAMRKQDASYAITTISSDQIEVAAPKSSAELLTQIPGVWVESSGGVSGANINVLGFPEAGDAPHVTFEINGAPIYGTQTLSFMEQSTLFRVDETIASVEGVIGGPGSVFAKGEPGLTANFRLREGGEQTEGLVKYTGSDYNLQRVDALLSGKLADRTYYMVGGYVSASPGIRDAQFLSEKGQQFTAYITHHLDRGKIGLWTRITDDVGQWLLPMFSGSGNNLGTFSQLGDYTRFGRIQTGVDGGGNPIMQTFDFANGRGWRGSISGMNAEFDTSDNTVLRDNLALTRGDADTYGFVPDGGAVQVSALGLAPGAVTTATSGQTLGPNDWVQEYGYWVVRKQLRSFTNDLSLAIKAGINNVTLGYYVAQWSSHDWWSLNNQAPVQNTANGDRLSSNVTCALLAASGSGAGCWHYGIDSTGDATAKALYLADSINATDALRIDLGVRHERQTIDYTLDSGPGYPDGTIDLVIPHESASKISYTGAANYAFSRDTGVYTRYTQGYSFPQFDSFRDGGGSANIQEIQEFEAGFKHTGSLWRLYATAFWNKTDAFSATIGGTLPSSQSTSRAYGVVLDGGIKSGPFSLSGNATFQNATYQESSNPNEVGKKVQRQPDVRLLLTPSYDFDTNGWNTSVYGALAYIGRRPSDSVNTYFFDAYTTIDAGVKVRTPWAWEMQLYGQNLSDRHDATEGDPRSAAANYRPILGRSVRFSVSYRF